MHSKKSNFFTNHLPTKFCCTSRHICNYFERTISIKSYFQIYHDISPLTFCLANPGSMTNTTPSMVREVSAMFVDTTTFLPTAPLALVAGGASKILCCRLGGRVEYSGIHFMSPTSGPRLSISLCSLLQASSISCKIQKMIQEALTIKCKNVQA